jgi:hypothetical protein
MDSLDQLLSPTVIDLLAEKSDMDINRIREWIGINVPNMLQRVVDPGGGGSNALVNDLRIASNEEVVR